MRITILTIMILKMKMHPQTPKANQRNSKAINAFAKLNMKTMKIRIKCLILTKEIIHMKI
jgi:uncharacterized membrane protein